MSPESSPAPPPVIPVEVHPSFRGACRGFWHLTWSAQLTWRRLPQLLISILVVPVLIFMTVDPPGGLPEDFAWQESAATLRRDFRRALLVADLDLERDRGQQLVQALDEERAPVDSVFRGEKGGRSLKAQVGAIQAYHGRVLKRARSILTAAQFTHFERFQQAKLDQALREVATYAERAVRPYFRWIVEFYFLLILPLQCLASCGAMIRDELQGDTLGFLITRPITRARLVIVKYLCHTAWMEITAGIHGLLLLAAGAALGLPGVLALAPLFLAVQALAVLTWSALSSLLGLVTQRYLVLGLIYGFVVEMGIGRIPTNINALSMIRHLKTLLANDASIRTLYEWSPQGSLFSTSVMILGVALFLAGAAALFTYREYSQSDEMQK